MANVTVGTAGQEHFPSDFTVAQHGAWLHNCTMELTSKHTCVAQNAGAVQSKLSTSRVRLQPHPKNWDGMVCQLRQYQPI